jgi:hypothetical protein
LKRSWRELHRLQLSPLRCELCDRELRGRPERNDVHDRHVAPAKVQEIVMHDIIYLVGLVVVVLFILSALGLR